MSNKPGVGGTAAEVADELAIRNLFAAYTDAINRRDADEAMRVYADESTLTMMERPMVTGRANITEVLRATLARYQLVTQMVHSGVVQLDGDRARARWQVTEMQIVNDGSRRFIVGRYEDKLVRLSEGWRFQHRVFVARYLGNPDLSGEAMPDQPTLFDFWD